MSKSSRFAARDSTWSRMPPDPRTRREFCSCTAADRPARAGAARSEAARRGYRAISLDLRGHGDSDWSPDGHYTLDKFEADVRGHQAHRRRAGPGGRLARRTAQHSDRGRAAAVSACVGVGRRHTAHRTGRRERNRSLHEQRAQWLCVAGRSGRRRLRLSAAQTASIGHERAETQLALAQRPLSLALGPRVPRHGRDARAKKFFDGPNPLENAARA